MRIVDGCLLIALAGFLAGCMSDEYVRTEGLTTSAGDSMRANTVMQLVDPWQYGVENTDLLVPANRGYVVVQAPGGSAPSTTEADD
jgi:hypothetical protein